MIENSPVIFFVSLGCAKNLVDTEVIAGNAVVADFLITANQDEADITIINTCSFINDAREEAEQEIKDSLQWKKDASSRYVVIAGCFPQQNIKYLQEKYPDIDLFLGLDEIADSAKKLHRMLKGNSELQGEFSEAKYLYNDMTPRLQLTPQSYAYIKIAEGCNHKCSFCSIPSIRGHFRSRSLESVVAEARNLLKNGVKELILIAQDTTYYGKDLNPPTSLSALIKELDKLQGDFWIRVLYTHPVHFTDEIIETFAKSTHLLPYVDIPLQHISDTILKAMKRGCSKIKTKELLEKIRKKIANATIRTSLIVGYPGETDEQFMSLVEFVKEAEFDRMGVFCYSPEPGTPAAERQSEMPSKETIEKRRDILMKLQQEISLKKNEKMLGKTISVIVEGSTEDGIMQGRSAMDAPDVDNLVFFELKNPDLQDYIIDVKITDCDNYNLYGKQI
ncbi:MAG: 30S ribosomal protein S12 methylthiotransferase RimO [Verrucomicrobiota bacterium]|nr:30S ribosomal protein S12 methylthiotransferase RimO [Verrucomicrobiota bacterium]